MSETNYISIKGAKVNNLKNIDVNIPRNKLVPDCPVRGNRLWHSIRSMPKGNAAMWKAFLHTHASSWDV